MSCITQSPLRCWWRSVMLIGRPIPDNYRKKVLFHAWQHWFQGSGYRYARWIKHSLDQWFWNARVLRWMGQNSFLFYPTHGSLLLGYRQLNGNVPCKPQQQHTQSQPIAMGFEEVTPSEENGDRNLNFDDFYGSTFYVDETGASQRKLEKGSE